MEGGGGGVIIIVFFFFKVVGWGCAWVGECSVGYDEWINSNIERMTKKKKWEKKKN